jgi:hypothetical protein
MEENAILQTVGIVYQLTQRNIREWYFPKQHGKQNLQFHTEIFLARTRSSSSQLVTKHRTITVRLGQHEGIIVYYLENTNCIITNTSIFTIAGTGAQRTVDGLPIIKGPENAVNNVVTLRHVRGDEC